MAIRVLKPQPSFQPWLETGLHIVQGRLGMALFQWITDPRFSFVRLRSRFAPMVIMFTEGLNQGEPMGQGSSTAPSFSGSPAIPVYPPVLSFAVFRILSTFGISQEGGSIKALEVSGLDIVNCDSPGISLELLICRIFLTAIPKIFWSPIGFRFLCLLFPWVFHPCKYNCAKMDK